MRYRLLIIIIIFFLRIQCAYFFKEYFSNALTNLCDKCSNYILHCKSCTGSNNCIECYETYDLFNG